MREYTAKEQELIREAYGRLRVWQDGCREMHDRAKEARKILLLQDPRQDEGKSKRNAVRKTIQLQTLKSTFTCCVADQMDNIPEARMLPETAELNEVADDLTDVVAFVLEQNDYEQTHRRLVEDLFCTGTAITQVVWDPDMDGGKGNIALVRWPVESFLWDPAAENIQDARAVMKVSWHPLSWFKQHYPEQYEDIGSNEGEFSGLGVPDAQEDNRPADEDRALLVEYWYRMYNAKTRRYTINVAYLAGGALLEQYEDLYTHGRYPFVVEAFTRIEGLPVGDGMIQEMAPMMRYVNRYADYIDMNLRMASKGRLLVNRNAGLDKDALTDWETDVIEGDRIDAAALSWLQTAPFSGAAAQQMYQLQSDIKNDSGQNQMTRGETAGGITAASAISALQEAGGKTTRLHTTTLQYGFKETAELVMWLISQYYDDKRVMYITGGKQNGPDVRRKVDASAKRLFGRERGKALPPPPYTVQVQVQRRNPLRQQAQNDLFMQAYSMAAQSGANFPLSVLFELLQVDGKEKILPVLREMDMRAQELAALQQQNEQLQAENADLQAGVQNLQSVNDSMMNDMLNSVNIGGRPIGAEMPGTTEYSE